MSNQSKKILILGIMLVFPLFIYAFLKVFGENEFTPLPVLSPEQVSGCPTASATAYTVPDFEFSTATGASLSQEQLKGTPYIAAFVDLQCSSRACTEVGLSLYRIQERFRENKSIKLLVHTANPAMDSAAVMKAYANRLKADPEQWHMLTGSEEQLSELGRCGYGLINSPKLGHSPMVALVDSQSQIRGYYDASNREDIDRLLTECALLLLHERKS